MLNNIIGCGVIIVSMLLFPDIYYRIADLMFRIYGMYSFFIFLTQKWV